MIDDRTYRHWRNFRGEHQANVRELRYDMTPCERTFWSAVRNRAIEGVKFRRQHPFEGFVLDFYAPELALVVEIDGEVHENAEVRRYDAWREGVLRASGLAVVRFHNAEIAIDLPGVVDRLRETITELRASRR
jgi:very-short-patch-repair endonuclease